EPDWDEVPSQVAMSALPLTAYEERIEETLRRKSWTILQLHGIEGSSEAAGWQPMPRVVFQGLLDLLASRKKDLWVAPFREVGAYWMGQKILEKAVFHRAPNELSLRWKK